MKTKSLPRLLSAVGGIALLFAVMTVPASAQTHATAKLRVAHFSPDTPGVDVYVDGKQAVGNMGFRTVTDYLSIPGGEHELALRPSGASATSPPVLSGGAMLDGGKAYTIAGLGSRSQLHVGVFVDDVQAPPEGKANVRFVQAVVGKTSVEVSLGPGQSPFGATKFGHATTYRAIAAGRYKVSLKDAAGQPLLPATSVVFSPGLTYTLAAIGGGDQPVGILPVVDQRGVSSAPAGGIATGAGGTAVRAHVSHLLLPSLFGAAAILLAGGFLLRRRQRVV
jgi:uncharacterized protein DUF4397